MSVVAAAGGNMQKVTPSPREEAAQYRVCCLLLTYVYAANTSVSVQDLNFDLGSKKFVCFSYPDYVLFRFHRR